MRTYETMVLLDAGRSDAEIEEALGKLSGLITERGGEVAGIDRWGRRRLAYEIEHLLDGYYAVVTYNLEPDKRSEVEGAMPFLEGFIRAKTVVPAARTRTP